MITALALSTALLTATDHAAIPDDVAKAALTWLLRQPPTPSDPSLCLLIDDRDPSEAVREFLKQHSPSVLLGSECHLEEVEPRRSRVRDKDGNPAEFLKLDGYKVTSAQGVSAEYTFWAGTLNGHGSRLELENSEGQWRLLPPGQYEWVE